MLAVVTMLKDQVRESEAALEEVGQNSETPCVPPRKCGVCEKVMSLVN